MEYRSRLRSMAFFFARQHGAHGLSRAVDSFMIQYLSRLRVLSLGHGLFSLGLLVLCGMGDRVCVALVLLMSRVGGREWTRLKRCRVGT